MKKLRPFDSSGWFAISNTVFDVIMPDLSLSGWKILCVAIRATWGWAADPDGDPRQRKLEDQISYSQFRERSGIKTNHTIGKAIDECLAKGYLLRSVVGHQTGIEQPTYTYRLNIDYELPGIPTAKNAVAPGAKNAVAPGAKNAPAPGAKNAPAPGAFFAHTKYNKQTNRFVGDDEQHQRAKQILIEFGIHEFTADDLASEHDLETIKGWIRYATTKPDIKNKPGFVVAKLSQGEQPPKSKTATSSDDRKRYISGKYAHLIEH
jgi:hypothetical protein